MRIGAACIFLCAGTLCTRPAAAIENPKLVRGVLILEGQIKPGDYLTVRNFLSDPSNYKKMSGAVFLASQGGNVFEALQIGYLIRRLRLTTDAPSRPPPTTRSSGSEIIRPLDLADPKRYYCTSACFLLYVAGIYREFIWAGRLGLHQPRLEHKQIGATEKDLATSTADMRDKLKDYFEQMNVPNKYLDLMYAIAPNEVRWITQTELNADLKGYIPEIRNLLDARCSLNRAAEDSTETRNCTAQMRTELRNEAWRKVFRRD
jgi:hypothetical protein